MVCVVLMALGLSSCLGDSKDAETIVTDYYNAIVTSFSLEANSNVCEKLSNYQFTIDNLGTSDEEIHRLYPNDGIIFNPDSLPKGSYADSVKVNISFAAADSAYLKLYDIFGDLGQYADYSKDSALFFASYPDCRLTIVSRGGYRKTYHIKINVHKVVGDTISWHHYTEPLFADMAITDQRTDTIGETLYWYVEEGGMSNKVSTSSLANGAKEWQPMADVMVPEGDLLDLKSLYNWQGALYALGQRSGNLLTSADGYNWEVIADGQQFASILGNQPKTKDVYGNWNSDTLNAIVRIDGEYRFATSANARDWNILQPIPAGFPITGFTRPLGTNARSNYGNLTSRLYIVGGMTSDGQLTSSTWSCDGWSDERQGTNWAEFPQDELPAMQGASIVQYMLDTDKPKSFWLLHPGLNDMGYVPTNRLYGKDYTTLYYSEDNGVSWHRLSRYYTQYADNTPIGTLACSSAFTSSDGIQMYFFGGIDNEGNFDTTVWGGQLNSLTFLKVR